MIEIKLTGEDALTFLQNEHKEATEQLKQHLMIALDQIDKLETQLKSKEPSKRIKEDSEKAKELVPSFVKKVPITKDTPKRKAWTEQEVNLIKANMKRPAHELNRNFKEVCARLGRTTGSVSAKLKELNIYVSKGVMYYKD